MNNDQPKTRNKTIKIYDNGVMTHYFIRCRKQKTGELGWYDTIEEKFYPDSPPLNKRKIYYIYLGLYVPLEYIRSTGTQYIDTDITPSGD